MDTRFLPKWIMNTLGVLLIIFLVLLSLQQIYLLKGPPQTMSVSATGKANGVPDVAIVTIGVVSEGQTSIEVKDKNNQKMNQVIAFIKEQGIDDKNIQTTGFYASPKYNYENGQSNVTGYQANQTLTVKINHIDQSTTLLEKVVDGAVMNGANQVQGINFSFSDDDELGQIARKQAIGKAKQKAKEIAKDAGLRLGKVINVVTGESSGVVPRPYAMNAAVARVQAAPNIEAGSQEVTETVTLVFKIC